MKLHLDSNNYVIGYTLSCLNYDQLDGVEYVGEVIPADFASNCKNYQYIDGQLVLDADKVAEENAAKELADLRHQREQLCFSYIDRSALWYNKLTTDQKEELNEWYDAWLNVTETRVVPETPEWLI